MITATGLVFTSDLGGSLYAFDTKSGEQLWHADTGSAVVAPITSTMVGGQQLLHVVVGQAGNQQTANLPVPHGSRVLTYRVGATQTAMNGAEGQVARAAPKAGATASAGSGEAPYTAAQVAAGATVFGKECASCHGAQLQGLAAPALTGAPFVATHPTLPQVHTVVTHQMPLTAPGSLSAADYAAVMAYILSYDCVTPADGGKTEFPSVDAAVAALKPLTFGSRSCPPGGAKE